MFPPKIINISNVHLFKIFSDESSMRMLDNENMTLEDAGFMDEDSLLAEIRSRYSS